MFVLVTVQSKKTVIKKLHVRIVISLLKCNKNELFKKSQDEFTSAKKLTSVESFDSKRRPTKWSLPLENKELVKEFKMYYK